MVGLGNNGTAATTKTIAPEPRTSWLRKPRQYNALDDADKLALEVELTRNPALKLLLTEDVNYARSLWLLGYCQYNAVTAARRVTLTNEVNEHERNKKRCETPPEKLAQLN